ncbi:MAG: glycosyltransferase [Clostridia bacterium]|nr:glycosyltransferase [Clostridia bacterium]
MKIVFTGGGTAGHIMPNIALINALDTSDQVFYFGGKNMEKNLVPSLTKGVNYIELDAPKFKRKLALSNLLLPFSLTKSVNIAKQHLQQISPDVIFAKGGYQSLPVALAGFKLNIPVVLHESDLTMGLANKLCAKRSSAILTTFEDTHPKAMRVGAPLRQQIYTANKQKGLHTMGFDGTKPIVLFLGGSLGANTLNQLSQQVYPLIKKDFDIFVLTGKNKRIAPQEGLHCAEFCVNIFDCLKASSVCITRGGANTLCELCTINLPFVVLPLTSNTRGEQKANANYFASKGCCLVAFDDILPNNLANLIYSAYDKATTFTSAQKRLKIDGTQKIIKLLYDKAKPYKG